MKKRRSPHSRSTRVLSDSTRSAADALARHNKDRYVDAPLQRAKGPPRPTSLNDPRLKNVLDDILVDMVQQERRSNGLPPISTQFHKQDIKSGALSEGRHRGEGEAPAGTLYAAQQRSKKETSERRQMSRMNQLPALKKMTSRSAVVTQQSMVSPRSDGGPAGNPGGPGVDVERIHSTWCGICGKAARNHDRDSFTNLFEKEIGQRRHVLEVEGKARLELRDLHFQAKEDERRRQRDRAFIKEHEELITKELQAQREIIIGEENQVSKELWLAEDNSRDDLMIFHRLSLRHIKEMREARHKTRVRQKLEAMEHERIEMERAQLMQEKRIAQNLVKLVKSEEKMREHLDGIEAATFDGLTGAFYERRAAVRNQEVRVMDMMMRHAARLQQLDAEKDRMLYDEMGTREKVYTGEKRSWESILSAEPSSRRKALADYNKRMKKEAEQRLAIENKAVDALSIHLADEDALWLQLMDESVVSADLARRAAERREELARRVAFRKSRETKELAVMFDEDETAFRRISCAFQENAVVLIGEVSVIEMQERRAMEAVRSKEHKRIVNNDRARRRLEQAETRTRSHLVAEQGEDHETMVTDFFNVQELFIIEWKEEILRREIEAEDSKNSADYAALMDSFVACSNATFKIPKTRPGKHLSHPESTFNLTPKTTQFSWFHASEPLAVFEDLVVRINASELAASSLGAPPVSSGASAQESEHALSMIMSDSGFGSGGDVCTQLDRPIEVSCLIQNPLVGDDIDCPHLQEAETGDQCKGKKGMYEGSVANLFKSMKFLNKQAFDQRKILTRVVVLTFDRIQITVHINVQPPICYIPSATVSLGSVHPLRHFNAPPTNRVKKVRLSLQVTDAKKDGHYISFQAPEDYGFSTKLGFTKDGKSIMKVLIQTKVRIDVEFDNLSNEWFKPLLAAIQVVRGKDVCPLGNVQLLATFVGRDEMIQTVPMTMNLDRPREGAVHLHAPSTEVYTRCMSMELPERLYSHIPENPVFIFHNSQLELPGDQTDVPGGSIEVVMCDSDQSISGSMRGSPTMRDRDFRDISKCQLSVAPHMREWHALSIEGDDLVCKTTGTAERVGSADGNRSPILTLNFSAEHPLSTEMVNAVLRSITFFQPCKGVNKPITRNIQISIDVSLNCLVPPIVLDFKLTLLPPILEAPLRNLSTVYKEGVGAYKLPGIEFKAPPQTKITQEAGIHIEITQGNEDDADEIDISGREWDKEREMWCFRFRDTIIGYWHERRFRNQSFYIFLTMGAPVKEWHRGDITAPYNTPPDGATLPLIDVTSAAISSLLKGITYTNHSRDPTELQKLITVTLDDGRYGRSSLVYELEIETVDDPSELHLQIREHQYRQNTAMVAGGFPLFPRAKITDNDSYDFKKGYIVVEHATAGGDTGDALAVLTPDQQLNLVHRDPKSATALRHLFDIGNDELTQSFEVQENPDAPLVTELSCLRTVMEEQRPILSVSSGSFFLNGEYTGSVTLKNNGIKDNPPIQCKFQFAAERQITLDVASYVLQCVAYENTSLKMKPGARYYCARLNVNDSTAKDTMEKVMVIAYQSCLNLPLFAQTVKYEERSGFKPIMKGATATIPQTLINNGYFTVEVDPYVDAGDVLRLDPDQVSDDNNNVSIGNSVVGKLLTESQQSFKVEFTRITPEQLQVLVRSVQFANYSSSLSEETRTVVAAVSVTKDSAAANQVAVSLHIQSADDPTEITIPQPTIVYMSHSPPALLCYDARVSDPDTDIFPAGSVLETTLVSRVVPGEVLCLIPTEELEARQSPAAGRIDIFVDGTAAASFAKVQQREDRVYTFPKGIVIDLTDCPLEALEAIVRALGYYNAAKGDRSSKKTVSLQLKVPGAATVKAQIIVELAPQILDFSVCKPQVEAGRQGVTLAGGGKMQLLPNTSGGVSLTVTMIYGNEDGDELSLKPFQDGSSLFVNSAGTAVMQGKKQVFARVTGNKGQQLVVTVENANAQNLQLILRQVQFVPRVKNDDLMDIAREVSVEFVAECVYGSRREVLRVQC